MKKLVLLALFAIPIFCHAQIILGHTISFLQSKFSDGIISIRTDDSGKQSCDMIYENSDYFYYFDEAGECIRVVEIAFSNEKVNQQVDLFNKKYVSLSETHWKVYLNNGAYMDIYFNYNREIDKYVFMYE